MSAKQCHFRKLEGKSMGGLRLPEAFPKIHDFMRRTKMKLMMSLMSAFSTASACLFIPSMFLLLAYQI